MKLSATTLSDYRSSLLLGASVLAVGAGWHVYSTFRRELEGHRRRLMELSQTKAKIFQTSAGNKIQYTHDASDGDSKEVALILHASGGGFDQGLAYGKVLLPNHRLICISRAGYLDSSAASLPSSSEQDSSSINNKLVEQQCHDLVELLETLHISKVTLVGMSVGGALALKLASLQPLRVASLVLLSPWVPYGEKPPLPDPPKWILKLAFGSDLVKWLAVKLAGDAMAGVTNETSVEDRSMVTNILDTLFPVQDRFEGFLRDLGLIKLHMSKEELLKITCPILYLAAKDDLQCKLEENKLPDELKVRHVTEETGGHLLIAKYRKVQAFIAEFLGN